MEDQVNVEEQKVKERKEKSRGKTFLKTEIDALLVLTKKYYNIIENKSTDSVTWKAKQQCWEKIAAELNSCGIYGRRSATQLHNKWNLLKKTARREYAQEKLNIMGTGGGEYKAPGISEISIKIHELGAETITGGTNEVDCDTLEDAPVAGCSYQQHSYSPQPNEDSDMQELRDMENIIIEYEPEGEKEAELLPENNWATYSPASLKQLKHPALNINRTPAKRYTCTKNVVKTYADMVEAKKEVAEMQKKYFLKLVEIQVQEEKNKKEHHEWAKEEHNLKMEILKEELNQLQNKNV